MVGQSGKFSGNRVVATAAAAKEPAGFDLKKVEDSMLAGAFAVVVGRIVAAPLDLLKIRFQVQTSSGVDAKYRNVWQAAKMIVKEEGLTSLWKGNLSATYLWVTYGVVQFGVYGALEEWSKSIEKNMAAKLSSFSAKDRTDPFGSNMSGSSKDSGIGISTKRIKSIDQESGGNRLLHTFMLFLCGASAAILATAATYPFDIMRTQFSLQGNTKIYASIPAFISTTLQKQGVKGFYAGLGPTLVGVTPYIGLNFALYDMAKKAVESSEEDAKGKNSIMSTVKKSIAGGFAGTTSKLMVYPLDTIKRRMQASVLQSTIVVAGGAAAAPQYKNMLDCCSTIFRNEGLQGLYRGVGPTILKSCVSTAVTFAAYEQGLLIAKKMRADREG